MTTNSNYPANTDPMAMDCVWSPVRRTNRIGSKLAILTAALVSSVMTAIAVLLLSGNVQIVYAADGSEFADAAPAVEAVAAQANEDDSAAVVDPVTSNPAPVATTAPAASEQEAVEKVEPTAQEETAQPEEAVKLTATTNKTSANNSNEKTDKEDTSSKWVENEDGSETLDDTLSFVGMYGGEFENDDQSCDDGYCGYQPGQSLQDFIDDLNDRNDGWVIAPSVTPSVPVNPEPSPQPEAKPVIIPAPPLYVEITPVVTPVIPPVEDPGNGFGDDEYLGGDRDDMTLELGGEGASRDEDAFGDIYKEMTDQEIEDAYNALFGQN